MIRKIFKTTDGSWIDNDWWYWMQMWNWTPISISLLLSPWEISPQIVMTMFSNPLSWVQSIPYQTQSRRMAQQHIPNVPSLPIPNTPSSSVPNTPSSPLPIVLSVNSLSNLFHIPLRVKVAPPPPSSNIITSPWLLIDILWKLSNIPTEITMVKSGCWLLTPTHKMSHCFSALIQPTHFRSTPSSLVFEINSENQHTDI